MLPQAFLSICSTTCMPDDALPVSCMEIVGMLNLYISNSNIVMRCVTTAAGASWLHGAIHNWSSSGSYTDVYCQGLTGTCKQPCLRRHVGLPSCLQST